MLVMGGQIEKEEPGFSTEAQPADRRTTEIIGSEFLLSKLLDPVVPVCYDRGVAVAERRSNTLYRRLVGTVAENGHRFPYPGTVFKVLAIEAADNIPVGVMLRFRVALDDKHGVEPLARGEKELVGMVDDPLDVR